MLGRLALQPAAAGLRTLLALLLSASWAVFLAAFLTLPARLNALINTAAAASPLSDLYYHPPATLRGNNTPHKNDASHSHSSSPKSPHKDKSSDPVPEEEEDALSSGSQQSGGYGASDRGAAVVQSSGPQGAAVVGSGGGRVCGAANALAGGSRPMVVAAPAGPFKADLAGQIEDDELNAVPQHALQYVRRNVWRACDRAMGQWGRQSQSAVTEAMRDEAPCNVLTYDECMQKYGRVPPLNVLIMVAGTRGDVQPATALGVRLRSHGHTVRLATHVPYRDLVTSAGLEFFPLAGDPRRMMELTVKHRGMLFSDLRDLSWLRGQYADIMDSCWEACGGTSGVAVPGGGGTGREQEEPRGGVGAAAAGGSGGDSCGSTAATNVDKGDKARGSEFQPDLIIATAITYGAVHCAEALGIPLHIISTIPWRPTQEICHPWARGFGDTLSGHCGALAAAALPLPPPWLKGSALGAAYGKFSAAGRAAVTSAANWWSGALLDHIAWMGIVDLIAVFRRRLGLPAVSRRNSGFALYDVPTTFTFSPSLVPPPRDWGPHVAVSGPLLLQQGLAEGHLGQLGRDGMADKQPRTQPGSNRAATGVLPDSNQAQPPRRQHQDEGAAAAGGDRGCGLPIMGGAGGGGSGGYTPPPGLVEFLEREPDRRPLYIGFGSMTVAEGRAVADSIRQAVATTGVRAVVSVGGWGCLAADDLKDGAACGGCGGGSNGGGNGNGGGILGAPQPTSANQAQAGSEQQVNGREGDASATAGRQEGCEAGCTDGGKMASQIGMEGAGVAFTTAASLGCASEQVAAWGPAWGSTGDVFLVADVPHEWLFPRCSAVIHHGGVGTTAAGLLAGCPTFVAPSFGDLFFWGEVCARAGVGPKPVPIYQLTAGSLENAIGHLQTEVARDAAKRAGARLRLVDGLGTATQHIYRGLLAVKHF